MKSRSKIDTKGVYHAMLDDVREAAERRGLLFRHVMMRACLEVLREFGEDVTLYEPDPVQLMRQTAPEAKKVVPAELDGDALRQALLGMEAGQEIEIRVHGHSLKAWINHLHRRRDGKWECDRSAMRMWRVRRID